MLRVNTFSGHVCLTAGGFILPGPIPINLMQTYNSGLKQRSFFGVGRSAMFDVAITHQGATRILWIGGDEVQRFTDSPASADAPFSLYEEGNNHYYVYSTREKRTYHFVQSLSGLSQLLRIRDLLGNRIEFERNDAGQILSLLDSCGRLLEFQYLGDLIRKITIKGWRGRPMDWPLLECEYDTNDFLVASMDVHGARHEFHYESGRLVSYVNPLGGVEYAQYDAEGRCRRKWEQGGCENVQFFYDPKSHTTRLIDSRGYTWLYRFNESGALLSKTDPLGGVTGNVLDGAGQLLATFDPKGEIEEAYLVEDAGTRYVHIGPGNVHDTFEYNDKGDVVANTDACGNRWERVPDERGGVRQIKSPLGYLWSFKRDRSRTEVIEPDGETTSYETDDDGHKMIITDALGNRDQFYFDVIGRLIGVLHSSGFSMEVEYFVRGQQTRFADGTTQKSSFNAMGQITELIDEYDRHWRYEYDHFGRLLQAFDPRRGILQYEYDAAGQPMSLTSELGAKFRNEYSPLGIVTRQIGFDDGVRDYAYDAAGRLAARTDANGLRLEITSDARGIPSVFEFPSGDQCLVERDTVGNLIRATDSPEELVREYDAHRRVLLEKYGEHEVQFEYGWRDLPTCIRADDRETRFTYDASGQLNSIVEREFRITIERQSKIETTLIRDGAQKRDASLKVVDLRDNSGNLVSKEVFSSAGETVAKYAFSYDRGGQLVERRRMPGPVWNFRYGSRGELEQVECDGSVIERFRYDLAHNRQSSLSGSHEHERGNRLVRSPHGDYTHDASGRRIRHEGKNGRSAAYFYDAFGRLSKSALGDGTVVEFEYDWLCRRRVKRTNGRSRQWIWAGDVPLIEWCPGGERIDYLFHSDEVVPYGIKLDGQWHYIVTDFRGEPLDVIRVADSRIVWSAEPKGFDSLVTRDLLDGRFRLRAPGQYVDDETLLLYNRARYYDPREGRFLTPDPLGPTTGANLYHYCFNQPFSYVDGSGLAPCPTKCAEMFAAIKETVESKKPPGTMKGLEQRWKETADAQKPSDILAWEKPPGGPNPPKGTVKGHIVQYDGMRNRLNNQVAAYDKEGCQALEDPARKDSMDYYRAWQSEKMKLGPGYGAPPPQIAALL